MSEGEPKKIKSADERIKEFEDYCWDEKTTQRELEDMLKKMKSSMHRFTSENNQKMDRVERALRRRFGFDPLTITP